MRLSHLDTPIVPLLQVVFTSILEVFLLCLAGYILAWRGILDKKTQKQLNLLNVSLFTPALLFSKVAFFLSPAKLRELWIIPIFFVLVTIVSMSVSFLLGWIFRLKRSQRSFAMAAAMFMNSNSLPIALMQSLVVTVPGLKWGSDDNQDVMIGRALTYLVLYSTLGMILRWSYGVRLLAQADDPGTTKLMGTHAAEQRPLLAPDAYSDTDDDDTDTDDCQLPLHISPPIVVHTPAPSSAPSLRPPQLFYRSFPNSPNQSQAHISPLLSRRPSTASLPPSSPSLPMPSYWRRIRWYITRAFSMLTTFMTAPLWAALASLFVACVRPVQHALEVHMQPVKGALGAAGNCSIPLTLVVLGAYFYAPRGAEDVNGLDSGNGHTNGNWQAPVGRRVSSMSTLAGSVRGMLRLQRLDDTEGHLRASTEVHLGETRTVVIAVASRMVITPLLLLPLMALSTRFNLQAVFDDPVFVVANVLLISSPPALTLAQITQAASGDAFERLISRTIFWAYCVVTPPATIIYVVTGMLLTKL